MESNTGEDKEDVESVPAPPVPPPVPPVDSETRAAKHVFLLNNPYVGLPSVESQRSPLNVIKEQALIAGANNLRSVKRREGIQRGRNDIINQLTDVSDIDHLPLVSTYGVMSSWLLSGDLVTLNLHGLDQVSDYVFKYLSTSKLSLPKLERVNVDGCVKLTDSGVKWMTRIFPNMREVYLNGCTRLTEVCIVTLLENCQQVHNINMMATSVAVIPYIIGDTSCSLKVSGCPLVSPTSDQFRQYHRRIFRDEHKDKMGSLSGGKVVVLSKSGLPLNLCSRLEGKDNADAPDVLSIIKQKEMTVIEVNTDKMTAGMFLSPGCVCVIPFELPPETDINLMAENLIQQALPVMNKQTRCLILPLAVYSSKETSKERTEESVQRLMEMFREGLEAQENIMLAEEAGALRHRWQKEGMNQYGQRFLAQLVATADQYKKQASLFTAKTWPMLDLKDMDLKKCYEWLLDGCQRASENYTPWLKVLTREFTDVVEQFLPVTSLTTLKELYGTNFGTKLLAEFSKPAIAKAMEVLDTKGYCSYFPRKAGGAVVTDFGWLEKVLRASTMTPGGRTRNHLRCLPASTPAWTKDELLKQLQEAGSVSSSQAELMLTLLHEEDTMIKLPCTERKVTSDPVHLYVPWIQLPGAPHIPLSEFWEDDQPPGLFLVDRHYSFLNSLPDRFMASVFRELSKVYQFTLLWKKGALLHQGAVTILLELQMSENTPVLYVGVRAPNEGILKSLIPGTKENTKSSVPVGNRKAIWATLKLVTSILDFIVLQKNVCARVSIPCSTCLPTRNRHELLTNKNVHHTPVHKAQAGWDRSLSCRGICGKNRSRYHKEELIGPDLPRLSSLIPAYDVGWLNKTSRPASRCSYCGMCATEGPRCPHNFVDKYSRICGCKGSRTIDPVTGMCNTCREFIQEVETTLEPGLSSADPFVIDKSEEDKKIQVNGNMIHSNATVPTTVYCRWPMQAHGFCEFSVNLLRGHSLVLKFICIEKTVQLDLASGQLQITDHKRQEVDPVTRTLDDMAVRDGDTITVQAVLNKEKPDQIDLRFVKNGIQIEAVIFEEQPLDVQLILTRAMAFIINTPSIPPGRFCPASPSPDHLRPGMLLEVLTDTGQEGHPRTTEVVVVEEQSAGDHRLVPVSLVCLHSQEGVQQVEFDYTKMSSATGYYIPWRFDTRLKPLGYGKTNDLITKIDVYNNTNPSEVISMTSEDITKYAQGIYIVAPRTCFTKEQLVDDETWLDYTIKKEPLPTPAALSWWLYQLDSHVKQFVFQQTDLNMSGAVSAALPSNLEKLEQVYPELLISRLSSKSAEVKIHPLCHTKSDCEILALPYSMTDSLPHFWLLHFVESAGRNQPQGQEVNPKMLWLLLACHACLIQQEMMDLPSGANLIAGPDGCTEEMVNSFARSAVSIWLEVALTLVENILNLPEELNTSEPDMETLVYEQRVGLKSTLDQFGLQAVRPSLDERGEPWYFCPGHATMQHINKDLSNNLDVLYTPYSKYMYVCEITQNQISSLPDRFFTWFPNLQQLDIGGNALRVLPPGVSAFQKLRCLTLSYNELTDLPQDMAKLKCLEKLYLNGNRFTTIPDIVMKLTSLQRLYSRNMQMTEVPDTIGELVNLEILDVSNNCIEALPASLAKCQKLKQLVINGISWLEGGSSDVITLQQFQDHLYHCRLDRWMELHPKEKEALFKLFQEDGTLPQKELGKLNAMIFYMFPRLGLRSSLQLRDRDHDTSLPSGIPAVVFDLLNLENLNVSHQAIHHMPDDVRKLKKLQGITLAHNPLLVSISSELGSLPLRRLQLEECINLRTPPKEIQRKGLQANLAYLKRLQSGSVPCKRTKLMFVGLGGAGKTSLVQALRSNSKKSVIPAGEAITDGIDITDWTLTRDDNSVEYSIWDFAGQTVYYNTHQFFLSNRAVYLLLWNIRLGYEHAGLDFWLSSIMVHAPNTPIFVVGTHADQVPKYELPMDEMKKKYPQIVGFHFISCHTGQGIDDLEQQIHKVTLQQSYMGEQIPEVLLNFEEAITSKRHDMPVMMYREVERMALNCGIFNEKEVAQSVQFLHELGSLQHFNNDALRDRVVIDPQWIVDVMACVVSVQESTIVDGRFYHKDISKVWAKYPENLRKWLLRLTEEFDLTFPLEGQEVNLVPCLLPEKQPQFEWPDAGSKPDTKEMKMIYLFTYLPAGLFNRGQVRLYQYSDSSVIWKKGSLLHKNGHLALILQKSDCELTVTVQGPRPENILFVVHEVFEALINESFQGVTYDYQLPCPDCMKQAAKDPYMFHASTVKRATKLKAPFLQCTKYFHVVTLPDMHGIMPPSSNQDYDMHLANAVRGLSDIRKNMFCDVFVSFCEQDLNAEETKKTHVGPKVIKDELVSAGVKCWFSDGGQGDGLEQTVVALRDAKVYLAVISSSFVNDSRCCDIFLYARQTLKKPLILAVVGSGTDWRKSKLGMLITDEVFVNLQKVDQYKTKIQDLLKMVKEKTSRGLEDKKYPPCFISYCWQNSHQAVAKGTKKVDGALGFGDPRQIKEYLEKEGIPCWIDMEQVGKRGLFEDIADGLTHARTFVACMSDQYASSDNCRMEFRFASSILKVPTIMALVGTGNTWRSSEVGMLSLNFPEVNFQDKTDTAHEKLLQLVKANLPAVNQKKDQPIKRKSEKEAANQQQQTASFQELYELAQRKFLRQITQYADQTEESYPRLLVLDFADSERMNKEQENPPESTPRRKLKRKATSRELNHGVWGHDYCFRLLCEHDEGWHSYSEPYEASEVFSESMLAHFSPYLARIMTLLKHSSSMDLRCIAGLDGMNFIKWLQELPQATSPDYSAIYQEFQKQVMKADTNRTKGDLARCHLPSGKTIWLCPKHQKMSRVTLVTDEVMTSSHTATEEGQENAFLSAVSDINNQKRALAYIQKWPEPKQLAEEMKTYIRKSEKKLSSTEAKKSKDNHNDLVKSPSPQSAESASAPSGGLISSPKPPYAQRRDGRMSRKDSQLQAVRDLSSNKPELQRTTSTACNIL